jgi:hypothetical protein
MQAQQALAVLKALQAAQPMCSHALQAQMEQQHLACRRLQEAPACAETPLL